MLTADVHFAVNTQNLEQPSAMYTWLCQGSYVTAAKVTGCTIHVNPRTMNAAFSDADRRNFEIHELAHCFLLSQLGTGYVSMPAWYVEGVPMWVETQFGTTADPKATR